MLSNITWFHFLVTVGAVATIYYFAVGIFYYTPEIKHTLLGKNQKTALRKDTEETAVAPEPDDVQEQAEFSMTENDMAAIEELVKRLKDTIAEIPPDKRLPDDFQDTLQEIFKAYPTVKYSTLRHSINELVVSEWEKYSAIILTEEDVDLCW